MASALLTRGDVARRLGCSVATVRRMQESGELVPVQRRSDGVYLFAAGDVERVDEEPESDDDFFSESAYRARRDAEEREYQEKRERDATARKEAEWKAARLEAQAIVASIKTIDELALVERNVARALRRDPHDIEARALEEVLSRLDDEDEDEDDDDE